MKELGFEGWRFNDEEREEDRARVLSLRPEGPLWIFGYGSLMWDPAIRFVEVLRAFAPLHERRMIVRDTLGGRGTEKAPGLMAALDDGKGCHGLIFRLEEEEVDRETQFLFQRERIGPAYLPVFIPVETEFGQKVALTFVADHGTPLIAGDLSRDKMVEYMATGAGWLGTSLDYGRNMVRHLEEMRLDDPSLFALVADAEAYRASRDPQ